MINQTLKLASILSVTSLLLVGCVGPITHPSNLMVKVEKPAIAPPAGKSLVLIHRPRNMQGWKLYTGVWDGSHFIADLGNGHSAAYVCEPGTNYFINRSVERVGVVEAQLLPDQIYDLRLNIAGAIIASFQIEPLKRADKLRKKLPKWEAENVWVGRGPLAAEHESERQSEIKLILHDFTSGGKQDRMRHLGPDDHR
jgi:hypothetical protein